MCTAKVVDQLTEADFIDTCEAQAQVEGRTPPRKPKRRAEEILAQHIAEGLGVIVPAQALKRFILENWWTLSSLAHAIHDREQPRPRSTVHRSAAFWRVP